MQIEYSQKKFENVDITNLVLFHGEVDFSTSVIYHFSAGNMGVEYADGFVEDFLMNINKYPLHMKVENDEINYAEIVNLLSVNQINFHEIFHNENYCCFNITIHNEDEFRKVYPYFFVAATCNLTAMYTMPLDFLWMEPLKESDINSTFMADFKKEGETLIALGFDGEGVEIWTTDNDLAVNDFYISKLEDKYIFQMND
ncbi:hypothetical protein AC622_11565 [Bacillus sp. FJAT-27916]|nr:hypothetical protein AC622_11565 [Bacillus sp. FJAT-27916]